MTVKDPYGNEACRWIGTEYVRPHSVRIDHMDNVWLVDDMANTITKCDPQGKANNMSSSFTDLVCR